MRTITLTESYTKKLDLSDVLTEEELQKLDEERKNSSASDQHVLEMFLQTLGYTDDFPGASPIENFFEKNKSFVYEDNDNDILIT